MDVLVERCAGLDVHRDNVVATVRTPGQGRRRRQQQTKTFRATLAGLADLLYVDERGDARQREALALILTGELGGTPHKHFPWVWKESRPLGWRPAPIEHTPRRGWFRAGDEVLVRVREPLDDQEPVTCVIPGHHRSGTELRADLLRVAEGPLTFEFDGRCAYRSTFEYSSTGE